MNTEKNNLPKDFYFSQQFIIDFKKVEINSAKKGFQFQEERHGNKYASKSLRDEIDRSNASISIIPNIKSETINKNKKQEQWSLNEYEHFWNQIDDLRRSYNYKLKRVSSNIASHSSFTQVNVSSKRNSISFESSNSFRMQHKNIHHSFEYGTNENFA